MVTNAGKNFKSSEFVANARILAIEVEEVPVEAYNSIGKIERYHGPLKRAFEIITADLGTSLTPEYVLQMAVKSVNDTAGHDGFVPTFLMFGTYFRLLPSSPPLSSLTVRANAMRKAMAEVRKLKARRQVTDAFFQRNGPFVAKVKQLPLQNEVRVWRESGGWTGSHRLLAYANNGNACIVKINGKPIIFQIIVVKPYYRDKHIMEPPLRTIIHEGPDDDDNQDKNYTPKPETPQLRRRGRSLGFKNKPKNVPFAHITQKEMDNIILAKKLR
jgi:hypothetical protein